MQQTKKRAEYEERVRLEAMALLKSKKLKYSNLTVAQTVELAKQNGYEPPEYGTVVVLGKLGRITFRLYAETVVIDLQNRIKSWRVSKVGQAFSMPSAP